MGITRIQKLELKVIEAAWRQDVKAVKALHRGIERLRGNHSKPMIGKIFGRWICHQGMIAGDGETIAEACHNFTLMSDYYRHASNDECFEAPHGPRNR